MTNAQGGTDLVGGSEDLQKRFPDFGAMADEFRAPVTQVHEIDQQTVLFLVEIPAKRKGRSLHNFAGLSDSGRMAPVAELVEASTTTERGARVLAFPWRL